jgi:hypothetical protein
MNFDWGIKWLEGLFTFTGERLWPKLVYAEFGMFIDVDVDVSCEKFCWSCWGFEKFCAWL